MPNNEMKKNNEILMLGFGIHVNFTQTPPLSSCSFCNSVFPSCMRDELKEGLNQTSKVSKNNKISHQNLDA